MDANSHESHAPGSSPCISHMEGAISILRTLLNTGMAGTIANSADSVDASVSELFRPRPLPGPAPAHGSGATPDQRALSVPRFQARRFGNWNSPKDKKR